MCIEILERRRLFAANVSEAYPGYYEIHGDGGDDTIDVVVSQSSESFRIDGQTYTSVAYIYVHGYGGNDTIRVLSEDGPGSIGASISAGDGNDDVTLNFDGAVWAGGGNDVVSLSDSYRGEVFGQDGNDDIYLRGACVDLNVRGGDGNDVIDASTNFCGLKLYGDEGNDTLRGTDYDDHLDGGAGNDVIYGGAGNDVLCTRDGESDDLFGGAGTDVAYVDGNCDGVYEVEYVIA